MIDRFGLLPGPTRNLFSVAELRQLAEPVGVSRIDIGPQGGRVEFVEQAQADPAALIRLIQDDGSRYRMEGPRLLRLAAELEDPDERFTETRKILESIQNNK